MTHLNTSRPTNIFKAIKNTINKIWTKQLSRDYSQLSLFMHTCCTMIYTIIILTLSSGFPATLASLEILKSILQKLLHYLVLLTFPSQPLTFLSMSTQLFKTNGNLVGIYTPIINCINLSRRLHTSSVI